MTLYRTRFDIGQMVWPIFNFQRQKRVDCETCGGKGRFEVAPGKHVRCPDFFDGWPRCDEGKKTISFRERWEVQTPSIVGMIQLAIRSDLQPNDGSSTAGDEERYMIESTGVGSGTLWGASNLYASEAEAQEECDRRNALTVPYHLGRNGQRVSVAQD